MVRDYDDDGCREYDDVVPTIATTPVLPAEHGPLGPIRRRHGRDGRHSPLDAPDNPNNRDAYDQRQKTREKKAEQDHRELMPTEPRAGRCPGPRPGRSVAGRAGAARQAPPDQGPRRVSAGCRTL